MSDFEARLRAALEAGAETAPDGTGLVAAVHRRGRERRRRRRGVLAACVLLGAVAVPGTLALLGADDPGPEPPASDTSRAIDPAEPSSPGIPNGLHPESWRDLEILVPNTWGHGTLATWCLADREPGNPVVERPGGVVSTLACRRPELGYGVQFLDPAEVDLTRSDGSVERVGSGDRRVYPAGSWVGYADAGGDAVVRVVARSEYVARYVLGSVRRVDRLDRAGCAPRAEREVGGAAGTVSVCRYAADGWLEQGERLVGAEARAALRAVQQAPVRRGGAGCPPGSDRHAEVELVTGGELGTARVVWAAGCAAGRGVFVGGSARELTAEVLYWALSPGWSGAVDASVPLPDPLRG